MSGKRGEQLTSGNFTADADLTGHQFRCVKQTSETGVDAAGAGERIMGILMNDPDLDEVANIDTDGNTKARAGAAFAIDIELMSDASGDLITATATNYVVAVSRGAAAASGDIVSIELTKGAHIKV